MAAIRGLSLEKVTSIKIIFSTFDSRVSSARELFRRVSSSKLQHTNPKCKVKTEILDYQANPTAEVTFSDGTKIDFNCLEMTALKMIEQINTRTRTITM